MDMAVWRVKTGQQRPGVDVCRGVAKALKLPAEQVLRPAGLLPEKPRRDELVEEILWYCDRMRPDQQAHFRVIARVFVESRSAGSRRDDSATAEEG